MLPQAIFETEPTGKLVFLNEKGLELFLYTKDDLAKGIYLPQFMVPEERGKAENNIRRILEGEETPAGVEYAAIKKDGTVFPVTVYASAIRKDDRIVGLGGIAADISGLKRAEKKVLHHATMIEGVTEGVAITSREGKIEYINPAAVELTGYQSGELIGQNVRAFAGSEGETFFRSILDALLAEASWLGRAKGRRKDASPFDAAVTVSPVRDSSGRVFNYLAIWRDISEQMKLERELRQAQKTEALAMLIGGIAHDFNNVLAAIIGFSELALEDVPNSFAGYSMPGKHPARRGGIEEKGED